MAAKRMRVFAGPNGSGKTTIFKEILNKEKINLGVYINVKVFKNTENAMVTRQRRLS